MNKENVNKVVTSICGGNTIELGDKKYTLSEEGSVKEVTAIPLEGGIMWPSFERKFFTNSYDVVSFIDLLKELSDDFEIKIHNRPSEKLELIKFIGNLYG